MSFRSNQQGSRCDDEVERPTEMTPDQRKLSTGHSRTCSCCFCSQIMLMFLWLLWTLVRSTLEGPVHRMAWSEGGNPVETNQDGSPRPSFHHLPIFQHAPGPLAVRELFRPVPHKRPLPAGLTVLLLPSTRQHQRVQGTDARGVEVWCGIDKISVRVDRQQLRLWALPSLFRLGSCGASGISPRFLYFHYSLTECDSQSKVVGGQLVYTFSLYYTPSLQNFIIRVLPLNLPIHCYYNRFHYSYQVGFRPQVQHTTFMKSIRSKFSYTLTVCNAQWEPLPSGHWFFLGEPVYFVAQTGALLARERLYVDSCYATSSKDPNSMPKVDIITNYGCMTDSKRNGSSSKFLFGRGSVLKFSVDTFLFRAVSQVLYLHCSISVSLTTSETAKSCSYNKATGRWEELEAPSSFCSCCDSMCTDLQDFIKNTVSSPGWFIGQKDEEKPRMKAVSFQAEESRDWVYEEERRDLKAQTPWELEIGQNKGKEEAIYEKTPVLPTERKELWQGAEVSQQQKKKKTEEVVIQKERSKLKELKTHGIIMSDQARPEENETIWTSKEVLTNKNGPVSDLSSENSTSNASRDGSTPTNVSFGTESDNISNGSDKNASTAVIPIINLCPNSDKINCSVNNRTIKHGRSDNIAGPDTMYTVISADSFTPYNVRVTSSIRRFHSVLDSHVQDSPFGNRLEALAGRHSASSNFDPPGLLDIGQSGMIRLEPDKLDTLVWSEQVKPLNKSVDIVSDRITGQGDSVNSKGPHGDDMLHSLQIRGLESDQSVHQAGFKDSSWEEELVGESNFDSGFEESEALHLSQSTAAAKTKEQVQEFSYASKRLPSVDTGRVSSEQRVSPSHSAMMTVTTTVQGSESSQMSDREWAEVVPGGGLQLLWSVVEHPVEVDEELRQEVMDDFY